MNKTTARSINGDIRYGDVVIAIPDSRYGCLIGKVIKIGIGSTGKYKKVHVSFKAFQYPVSHLSLIEEYFCSLSGKTLSYDELPIHNASVSPKKLIRLTELSDDEIYNLVENYEEAESYCNKILGVESESN